MPLRNDTFLNGWGDFFRNPSYSFLSGKPHGAFLTSWDGNSLMPTAAGCFHWGAEGRGVSGMPRLSQRGAATHWAIARRQDGHTDGGPSGAVLLSGHPGGECGRRFPAGAAGARGTAVTARRAPGAGCPARRRDRRARPCAARPAFPPPAPPPCLPEPPPGLRAPPPLRPSPLFGGVPGGRPTGTFDCLFLTDSIESPPGQLYYRIDLFRQIK